MADNIIKDTIDIVNEEFYLLDTDFDSNYCEIVFTEIYNGFIAAKKESQARIEILKFIKKIIENVDRDKAYDYTLFMENIHLLPLSFLRKQRIISTIEKQIQVKKIG